MKRVTLPVAVVTGVFGAILSFFFAGFSGAGGHIALLHGMTLTASVSASFLVLCRGEVSSSMIFPSFLILPAVASAWSLFTGVVVAASASAISDGNPYCLASHGERKAVSRRRPRITSRFRPGFDSIAMLICMEAEDAGTGRFLGR